MKNTITTKGGEFQSPNYTTTCFCSCSGCRRMKVCSIDICKTHSPTETVSDCCGAEVKVGMSGFGDGLEKYNYCSKCRKMCDLVKHNPPTEPNDLQPTTPTINTTRQEEQKVINKQAKQQLTITEPTVEKWDISAKPKGAAYMITDSIFNAIEWEKHYTVKERQALNDVVDEIIFKSLAQSVQEAKAGDLEVIYKKMREEIIDEIYNQGNRTGGYHDPRIMLGYIERVHYEQHKNDKVMVVGEQNCKHAVLNVNGDCPYCKKHLCDSLEHRVLKVSCNGHNQSTLNTKESV